MLWLLLRIGSVHISKVWLKQNLIITSRSNVSCFCFFSFPCFLAVCLEILIIIIANHMSGNESAVLFTYGIMDDVCADDDFVIAIFI